MTPRRALRAQEPPAIRPEFEHLPGYTPIVPLAERARRAGVPVEDALKLDANENPFGLLPAIADAIAACTAASIYPDPSQAELRAALSRYVDAPAERIVAGSGSDELIDLVVRVLVAPGEAILIAPPTFGMYRFVADINGVSTVMAPRGPEFVVDWDALIATAEDPAQRVAMVILASPNNPTGDLAPEPALRALLDRGLTVVLDEAYAEFSGESAIPLTDEYPRLLVMRTFSKWAALAGLRVGYGVFPPSVAQALMKVKQPYNVNSAGEAAALAALAHREELGRQTQAVVATRDKLVEALAGFSWIRAHPSRANFLLCRVPPLSEDAGSNMAAGKLFTEALAEQGVFVRFFSEPRLRNCFRISVPRPGQLETLLARLQRAAVEVGIDSGAYTQGG